MLQHYNVLFRCTGNSRVVDHRRGHPEFSGSAHLPAFGAGSHPAGKVQPEALRELERAGLSTTGPRSKNWDEFVQPGAPPLDFLVRSL